MERKVPNSINEYISWFPDATQEKLNIIRKLVKEIVPEAEESISYNIPAFKHNGIIIYFAGFKNHVSVYPAPRQNELFEEELKNYKGGKGTIQLPISKELPIELLKRIILFRVSINNKKN